MEDNDRLLIRVYDVGFGDCIYIRVPDRVEGPNPGQSRLEHRHILIDCGTVGKKDWDETPPSKSFDPIGKALRDIRTMLPQVDGERQLDLLVVTHPHQDHISGFTASRMAKIRSRHVWLSIFMDRHHPQAKQAFAFEDLAYRATLALVRQGLRLGPGMMEYLQAQQGNAESLEMLKKTLPDKSEPGEPLYVSRDIAERRNEDDRQAHRIAFRENTTCFEGFQEPETCLRVLAPEWDIDKYYLSLEAKNLLSLADRYPQADDAGLLLARAESGGLEAGDTTGLEPVEQPGNISRGDFRVLRNRLLYSAMRYQEDDDELKNDVSVVLLLEWRGHKLLFAGDAEWKGGYREDEHNGSWDVLWMKDQAGPAHLAGIDYLKVGHHGSENATPWYKGSSEQPILQAMLPQANQATAQIVVSTCRRKTWPTVPCRELVKTSGGILRDHGTVRLTNEEADLEPGKNYIETTFS